MVDAQRAGMAHAAAQDLDDRRIGAGAQGMRRQRCQAPVLAGLVELVGRRAEAGTRDDAVAIGPGLGAIGRDADREVEIEPERHRGGRLKLRLLELRLCQPLQPGEERHALAMPGGEVPDLGAGGILIGQGPGAPGVVRRVLAVKMLEQRVEQRLPLEARAALAPEGLERRPSRASQRGLETLEQQRQDLELERRDGRIVDQLGTARPLQAGPEIGTRQQGLRRRAAGQLRHLLDRDEQDVEEAPAGGRVGAVALRCCRQLGVDRVDADEGRAEAGTGLASRPRSAKSPIPQLVSERTL